MDNGYDDQYDSQQARALMLLLDISPLDLHMKDRFLEQQGLKPWYFEMRRRQGLRDKIVRLEAANEAARSAYNLLKKAFGD